MAFKEAHRLPPAHPFGMRLEDRARRESFLVRLEIDAIAGNATLADSSITDRTGPRVLVKCL